MSIDLNTTMSTLWERMAITRNEDPSIAIQYTQKYFECKEALGDYIDELSTSIYDDRDLKVLIHRMMSEAVTSAYLTGFRQGLVYQEALTADK